MPVQGGGGPLVKHTRLGNYITLIDVPSPLMQQESLLKRQKSTRRAATLEGVFPRQVSSRGTVLLIIM